MANETNIYFLSSVHGFERTNVSVDEDSLDEMVTVRLYLKGNVSSDPDPPQCQNFIFNIISLLLLGYTAFHGQNIAECLDVH